MDPGMPGVKEIYVGALEASEPSASQSNTSEVDETLVDFINILLELLDCDSMPVNDQIEILRDELASLRYLLKDAEKFTKRGKLNDLLAHAEVMVIHAGSMIYSLFEREVNREIAKELRLGLSELLDKFRNINVRFTKIYVDVIRASISNCFPMIDELGAFNLLLRDMEELLNDRVDSITLLKDHIHIVQRDLEFLGSFLTRIAKEHHEHKELDLLWRRIIRVMYEVEYVIDLVVVKDGHVLCFRIWLSNLIEEINFIKTEINEMRVPDKNLGRIYEFDLNKIPGSPELSQMKAPIIDGEMDDSKDREEKLVEQLLYGSNQLQIVSIVGMPGLGKTFLANKAYNNPKIRDHFDVCAWCNVSQVYEKGKLLNNILSQVNRSTKEMSKMIEEDLAGDLKRCLLGRRYLIVLDDVWDIEAWNELQRSFPNEKLRSRIVFTSRFSNLALQARPDSILHQLQPFSKSESWELLQKKIFQKESCPLELLEVGQEIAEGCNGLPLTIVVVAGLLARKTRKQEQWREVAKNLNSYIFTDLQSQCMNALDFSYKSLPDYLKPCLLYFGGFPEDMKISTMKLMQFWIAEGFVLKNEPDLEYIVEGYLMDLIDRNLIIASEERSTGGVKTCIVHDLVHEFCVMKAKEERFLKVIDTGNLLTSMSSCSTSYEQRRLFVHFSKDSRLFGYSSDDAGFSSSLFVSCVRSVVIIPKISPYNFTPFLNGVGDGFKLLRVLDLLYYSRPNDFPVNIVSLVQLRYLALPKLIPVPSSIANLGNLQTFIIRGGGISADAILNMKKLRHLYVDDLYIPEVSSFGDSSKLDSLQTLGTLRISYGGDMKFLRRFSNLKKLSIYFEKPEDSSQMCNQFPELGSLRKLESLNIGCSYGKMMHLSEFCLPSTLKKLTISELGLQWEHISIVGKLPNLQVLKLVSSSVWGEEWIMQDGEFPKLKVLKLDSLDIKRWIASGEYFPPIEQLIVSSCFELEEIPSCLDGISTLKLIDVDCFNSSLVTAINQIQEEQRDFGNEELAVYIKEWFVKVK